MTPKHSPETIAHLDPHQIFVFGSNLAGRHGAGAAKVARDKFGAKTGQGIGFQGQCYAVPTKDENITTLPLADIRDCVDVFLCFARAWATLEFLVTRIGCGLAGYSDEHIAPMFKGAPDNVLLPKGWREIIEREEQTDGE